MKVKKLSNNDAAGVYILVICVVFLVVIAGVNSIVYGAESGFDSIGKTKFGMMTYSQYQSNSNKTNIKEFNEYHGGAPVEHNKIRWEWVMFMNFIPVLSLGTGSYFEWPDDTIMEDYEWEAYKDGVISEDYFKDNSKEGSNFVELISDFFEIFTMNYRLINNLNSFAWIIRVPIWVGIVGSLVELIWIG